jgi:hypothetical protein
MTELEQNKQLPRTEIQDYQEKISKEFDIFLAPENKDAHVHLLLEKIDKNQIVFDLILSEIQKNVDTIKNLPSDKKNIIITMLLDLWKEDSLNTHITRDPMVYKELVYLLMWWEELDNNDLEQKKQNYTLLAGFADGITNLCLEFLSKIKWNTSPEFSNFFSEQVRRPIMEKVAILYGDFLKNISSLDSQSKSEYNISSLDSQSKSEYTEWAANITTSLDALFKSPDKDSDWKQRKLNNLIKDAYKPVKQAHKEFVTTENQYTKKFVAKSKSINEISKLIEVESSQEFNPELSNQIRSVVKNNIWWLESTISERYRDMVMPKIEQFLTQLDATPDQDVPSFVKKWLEDARKALAKYSFVLWKEPERAIDAIMVKLQPLLEGKPIMTQAKKPLWSDVLLSQPSLDKYIMQDDFIPVYDDLFDIMYRSDLQAWTFDFKGEMVQVNDDHIEAFKKMLAAKAWVIDDWVAIDLMYNSKDANNNYPEGMRLVVLTYSDGTKEYILPWTKNFVTHTVGFLI